MRTPLHRFCGQGDLHFITFSCYARRPYLGSSSARNKFLQILDEVRSRQKLQLLGYVVMPEHVHLVISEPRTGDPSKSMQVLKQTVSRQVKLRNEAPSTKASSAHSLGDNQQAFWQRRFYDFNVWSRKRRRKARRAVSLPGGNAGLKPGGYIRSWQDAGATSYPSRRSKLADGGHVRAEAPTLYS
jgi:REP element-mobilizing transposase RayT